MPVPNDVTGELPAREVALPPSELIARVGHHPENTRDEYHAIGARHRRVLESYLPSGWVWSDKTYLDWGAGAGRLVHRFLREAEGNNRIIGADIHEPSVEWIRDHLSPVEGLLVHEAPGIALDDNSVDLVSGFSVMTHITDHWAGWLLEIRRVLRPGGLALLSSCGEEMLPVLLDGTEQIDDVGMLVLKYGNPWTDGGPTVLHSPWWIRTHWGRAFEIVRTDLGGSAGEHDLTLLRKPSGPVPTVDELELVDAGDANEMRGFMSTVRRARAELCAMREDYEVARAQHEAARADCEVALAEASSQRVLAEDLASRLDAVESSHSWKVTRPLRALSARLTPAASAEQTDREK